jgi:hypothetical protein
MNYVAAIGMRELNDAEINVVSGGLFQEALNELGRTIIKEGAKWLYQQGVGWIQTQITNANQTGVAGQPGYVDAMGNASGVSTMTESDNTNNH